MASTRRRAKRNLRYQLKTEPFRFSFVQSVRLLERICERQRPPKKRVGYDTQPELECVRFRALVGRSFPPTEVVSLTDFENGEVKEKQLESSAATQLEPASHDAEQAQSGVDASLSTEISNALDAADAPAPVPKLTVAFMGLFGPSGVLPQHDTQRIIDAGPKKNPERDFLDVFNHRIISLFYRASIKYRIAFSYEANFRNEISHPSTAAEDDASNSHEPRSADECDLTTRALYSLAGMGTAGLRRRLVPPSELSIEFAGLFGQHPKNATSLQRMLESYFELPISIMQFVGQWMNLSSDNISMMPTTANPLGQNCALGRSFILGQRVWDIAGKFRIKIGPLDRATFEEYLPGTQKLQEVAQIVNLYAGNQFDFDIQLELLAAEVPPIQLGGNSRLGLNTWLFSEQPTENKTEPIFVQSGLPTDQQFTNAA
ncbi:MAG: type VI secretion system baseplate subunit TssG [Pirellulaceae bacterium]